MKDTLKVGASTETEIVTTPEMGITHLGPDAPRMYSTPAMISLMEQTSIKVLTPHLDEGEQSVGTKISVSHFKATAIGQKVRAKATLTEIVQKAVNGAVGFDPQREARLRASQDTNLGGVELRSSSVGER